MLVSSHCTALLGAARAASSKVVSSCRASSGMTISAAGSAAGSLPVSDVSNLGRTDLGAAEGLLCRGIGDIFGDGVLLELVLLELLSLASPGEVENLHIYVSQPSYLNGL